MAVVIMHMTNHANFAVRKDVRIQSSLTQFGSLMFDVVRFMAAFFMNLTNHTIFCSEEGLKDTVVLDPFSIINV